MSRVDDDGAGATPDTPLLAVEDLRAGYDESEILHGVSLSVERGEVVSLIGRNGAGKTTTFRAIMGVITPTAGRVVFDGEDVTGTPDHALTRRGVRFVPEDRRLFPDLTVMENLRMGRVASEEGLFTIEETLAEFPRLEERAELSASNLSGGEQQMLAIARALVGRTELLVLDEPSEGLAPQIVEDVVDIVGRVSEAGVTILISEQNIPAAMAVADRHHVIDKGEIVFEGTNEELEAAEEVRERHLSVGVDVAAELFE